MDIRAPIAALFVLAVALAAPPAQAAPADQPLLIYGPQGPAASLEERAVATYNLLTVDRRASPHVRHVGTVVAGVPEVEVVGGGESRACPGSHISLVEFQRTREEAEAHVLYGRRVEMELALERLGALLPCLNEVLPRGELVQIGFLEGIGHAYLGEEELARESFRRALVVSPTLAWDERYPPDYGYIFDHAIRDALLTAVAEIEIGSRVNEAAALWIDGEPFPAGGVVSTLAVGTHLLQWKLHEGGFHTRAVRVEEDQRLTVISRGDVADAAITGQGSEAARALAERALRDAAAATGVTRVHLAELGDVDLLHRFDADTGQRTLTDEGMLTQRLASRRLTTAGGISMGAAGVLGGVGTVLALHGYTNASDLLNDAEDVGSEGQFDEMDLQYGAYRREAILGCVILGAGGVALATGIPMVTAGARAKRRSTPTVAGKPVPISIVPGPMGLLVRF